MWQYKNHEDYSNWFDREIHRLLVRQNESFLRSLKKLRRRFKVGYRFYTAIKKEKN